MHPLEIRCSIQLSYGRVRKGSQGRSGVQRPCSRSIAVGPSVRKRALLSGSGGVDRCDACRTGEVAGKTSWIPNRRLQAIDGKVGALTIDLETTKSQGSLP